MKDNATAGVNGEEKMKYTAANISVIYWDCECLVKIDIWGLEVVHLTLGHEEFLLSGRKKNARVFSTRRNFEKDSFNEAIQYLFKRFSCIYNPSRRVSEQTEESLKIHIFFFNKWNS